MGIGDKNSSKVTFSLLVASAEALVVGLWYIYMYNCMYNGMYNCIFAMHHHNRHQPFEIFTRPSSSVTPVTQDHFYSINATQYNAPPRKLRDAIPSQVPHPTCFWTSMAVQQKLYLKFSLCFRWSLPPGGSLQLGLMRRWKIANL